MRGKLWAPLLACTTSWLLLEGGQRCLASAVIRLQKCAMSHRVRLRKMASRQLQCTLSSISLLPSCMHVKPFRERSDMRFTHACMMHVWQSLYCFRSSRAQAVYLPETCLSSTHLALRGAALHTESWAGGLIPGMGLFGSGSK